MSLSDIRHTLRKLEFPASVREALVRIEQLLVGRTAPSSKQLDMAMDIISEFVFCDQADRRRRVPSLPGLNPLQELQLIEVICDYVCSCASEITVNTVFLSLFGADNPKRLKVLCTLASMAVSASCVPVLVAVGMWLQQTGCSSPPAARLTQALIRDHFQLNTTNQSGLKSLASAAPQFVANFIAAATELYLQDGNDTKLPPKNLLEVITSWVYCNPGLCLASAPAGGALPAGAIAMPSGQPLPPLIAWTTVAPLALCTDTEMSEPVKQIDQKLEQIQIDAPLAKRIKLETSNDVKSHVTPKQLSEEELYTKLHLGVLHSLRAKRGAGPPTAVHAGKLASLAAAVRARAAGADPARLQECLDRLGQSVQVALASGCVYGSVSALLHALQTLPDNRLIRIVVRTHHQAI